MGMAVTCDEDAPIPRPTVLALVCDAGGCGGLFGPASATWSEGGYAENVAKAKSEGWKETHGRDGRMWLCPGCSGKAT